ncbi:mechanosensitive ion channel [Geomicrobium sp. JCM 19055]|uniref:mechanosensitive ion channel n=1 Tax=Geomicrobium sp. JCM 19055 TaxID=1460649 RepID=UPI00045ED982|nr:mechanosensitive ion channel [Geomicrobium sp. JCM 19055]GAK01581.1 small-conductance mechanosensitive channel [Geomicrobium sp. JCM 19055]
MGPVENVLNSFLSAVPSILTALLLLLLAWVIAIIVKKIIFALIKKLNFKRFQKNADEETTVNQLDIADSASKVVYYLVFILFLPSILDALNMNSVSQPITNMMSSLLEYLPNILIATIVFIIGILIAKVVRSLTQHMLLAINFDSYFNKLKLTDGEKPETYKLSNVLSNIVMIIVLIPIITIALEALRIESVSTPIVTVLSNVVSMIPNIFVAIILLIAGYYIATFVSRLLTGLLSNTGINKVYSVLGLGDKPTSLNISSLLGTIVKVIIILVFTVEALNILQLNVLNQIGNAVLLYLPLLVSAILILGIGLAVGHYLYHLIVRYTKSKFSALIIKYVIILFAVFMTLEQLGFASSIVTLAFLLILGGLAVAFAISFGIGGREFAKRQLEKFESKINENND